MTAEQVCAVIERETGEPVTPETSLESLEVDSLEFLNLLVTLGGEAGKDIPVEKSGDLHTVSDIIAELA